MSKVERIWWLGSVGGGQSKIFFETNKIKSHPIKPNTKLEVKATALLEENKIVSFAVLRIGWCWATIIHTKKFFFLY